MSFDAIWDSERLKYETVWGGYPEYRTQADGDPVVDLAFKQLGCKPGESLIDWGCGKGTPAQRLQAKGLKVTGFDIARNCLDKDVKIPLIVGSMWDPPPWVQQADYAFCTDVLEHLPPDRLELALSQMCRLTRKAAFIQVCTVLDTSGPKMNPPMRLHLSVYPHEWWGEHLAAYWTIEDSGKRGKARSWFVCRK